MPQYFSFINSAIENYKWAIENGASGAADGLGMLVEQAAETFMIWHGIKPDTSSVIKILKDF